MTEEIAGDGSRRRSRQPRTDSGPLVYRIVRCVAWIVLHALYQIEIEGADRLPCSGAFVLLPKHQRWLDVPLIGLAVPCYLHYVAKYELFAVPLLRWLIGSLGGIPLNRRRPIESRRTLHAIRHYLNLEQGLVVFPEGTYFPGTVGPGNLGILRFIVAAKPAQFIPVGIRYIRHPLRSVVCIRFGEPIAADERTDPRQLLALIMQQIAELSGMSHTTAMKG